VTTRSIRLLAICQIDSFDPWGVELGTLPATRIVPELRHTGRPVLAHDSSTNEFVARYGRLAGLAVCPDTRSTS
jgi:hypothetical protein